MIRRQKTQLKHSHPGVVNLQHHLQHLRHHFERRVLEVLAVGTMVVSTTPLLCTTSTSLNLGIEALYRALERFPCLFNRKTILKLGVSELLL